MEKTSIEMLWYVGLMIGIYVVIMFWVEKSGREPWKNKKIMMALKAAAAIGLTAAGGYATYNKAADQGNPVQIRSP